MSPSTSCMGSPRKDQRAIAASILLVLMSAFGAASPAVASAASHFPRHAGRLLVTTGIAFQPKTDYATGFSPRSVTIGDLNGDGFADLVVANGWSSFFAHPGVTVSVLLGNGNGTFRPKTDFGTGVSPFGVAIGDLNGDAKPDLAVANYQSTSVSVLLGNGDGTFGVHAQYSTALGPVAIAAADLDGDGKLDLAVAAFDGGRISVFRGNGDGSFGAKTDYVTGSYPYSIAIGDMDGDGASDLLTASQNTNTVSVLLNIGDGTFSPKSDYPTGGNPFSLAIGDMNSDGELDAVTSNNGGSSVSVLPGNGDGSLGANSEFAAGSAVYGVAVGDLNADGRPDVAVTNVSSRTVSVLLGGGGGSLGAATAFATGDGPIRMAIGDLNGDSRPDLAVANVNAHSVSVLLNDSPTATLLALFEGRWTGGAIEVRWQFGGPEAVRRCELERGDGVGGPWSIVEGQVRTEQETTVLLDRTVSGGHEYFYRLVATMSDGEVVSFGPLAVEASDAAHDFALLSLTPSLSRDRVEVGFSVAREAPVRLTVVDLHGRQLAVIAEGVYPAGLHQAVWSAASGPRTVPAGLYFVRYESPMRNSVRKLIIAR